MELFTPYSFFYPDFCSFPLFPFLLLFLFSFFFFFFFLISFFIIPSSNFLFPNFLFLLHRTPRRWRLGHAYIISRGKDLLYSPPVSPSDHRTGVRCRLGFNRGEVLLQFAFDSTDTMSNGLGR